MEIVNTPAGNTAKSTQLAENFARFIMATRSVNYNEPTAPPPLQGAEPIKVIPVPEINPEYYISDKVDDNPLTTYSVTSSDNEDAVVLAFEPRKNQQ